MATQTCNPNSMPRRKTSSSKWRWDRQVITFSGRQAHRDAQNQFMESQRKSRFATRSDGLYVADGSKAVHY